MSVGWLTTRQAGPLVRVPGDYRYLEDVVRVGYPVRAARTYLNRHLGNPVGYRLVEAERGETVRCVKSQSSQRAQRKRFISERFEPFRMARLRLILLRGIWWKPEPRLKLRRVGLYLPSRPMTASSCIFLFVVISAFFARLVPRWCSSRSVGIWRRSQSARRANGRREIRFRRRLFRSIMRTSSDAFSLSFNT